MKRRKFIFLTAAGFTVIAIPACNYVTGDNIDNPLANPTSLSLIWDENDDTFPDSTNGGWHHMGTTRMSNDPKKGVVNSNCQVHGISNLFIAGGACNVTSGAPNPTLTVTALSLRLSDHIKNKMNNNLT